jgi:cell division protein FtsQ
MAADFSFPADEIPLGEFTESPGLSRGNARRPPREVSRGIEKRLKRLFVIAGIVLGAELIWLFGISPCIPLSTISVEGFPGFEGGDVLRYADIGGKASFISVKAREAEKILSGHYLVEKAKVVKRFPDRLSIYLEPRQAAALILASLDGRLLPVYFDRHGVALNIGGDRDLPQAALPVISGLVIEEPFPGMRLPSAFGPLLEELGRIGQGAPELLGAISEIRINRRPFDGFDLVLYPVHYPIRVRLGNNFNEDTLRYVLLMLDVFEEKDSAPEEIDFRSGVGAYTAKEAPSGE